MKKITFLLAGIVTSLTLLVKTAAPAQDISDSVSQLQPAPQFSLPDLQGDTVRLSDFRGKFVVIHIATTWCPYCNAEAPNLEKLYQNYRDREVMVLIVDVKEPAELVKARLQERFNLSFPVLLDADGAAAGSFAPEDVLPELGRDEIMLASNLLIDPDGNIQFMSLLDTRNFDTKLVELRTKLDELLPVQ